METEPKIPCLEGLVGVLVTIDGFWLLGILLGVSRFEEVAGTGFF